MGCKEMHLLLIAPCETKAQERKCYKMEEMLKHILSITDKHSKLKCIFFQRQDQNQIAVKSNHAFEEPAFEGSA